MVKIIHYLYYKNINGLSVLGGIKEQFISHNMTTLQCKRHIKLLSFAIII